MLQTSSSVIVVYRRKTLTGSPDPTHATRRIKHMHNWWRIQPVGSVHKSQDKEEAKADKTREGNKESSGSDYCKSEIFS